MNIEGTNNICWSCHNSYVEYGCLLCKKEGDDISQEYYDDAPVTRCKYYDIISDDEINYLESLSQL